MKNLDLLPGLIDKTFPLPARFRPSLKQDVAELSRLLTSERPERGSSYLGKPALLSAYLRYFFPWNIYRLSRAFGLLPLELKPNDAINDLGAGPLTLAASLWVSRPDLRNIPLEFRCLDRTAAVLEAGKKFFAALAPGCPWTVRTIRGELRRNGSLSVEIRGKPAALSAAVNVYNELFWGISPHDEDGLRRFADNQARLLSSLTESSGSILVVEPGIPRSGEFISLLRSGLMSQNRFPLAPCTHCCSCPLPGGRTKNKTAKWCHFAFDTEDAPLELHRLSAAAKIPKERAVLSFLLAGPKLAEGHTTEAKKPVKIRIISDSFPVDSGGEKTPTGKQKSLNMERGPAMKRGPAMEKRPAAWGRYGCSGHGLVLVTGSRAAMEKIPPGALEELPLIKGATDAKSGALVAKKNDISG